MPQLDIDGTIMVRAIYRAIAIADSPAPYDRASLKIFYPGNYGGGEEERNSGVVPAANCETRFPVVIILPGINVGPEAYSWLAHDLARQGIVSVTFTLIAEEMPGYISLTPGLSISALTPENYGLQASATAVAAILEELKIINQTGVLQGRLNLNKVILGGHSAGGSVALLNARADWFPGLCAAFSYGAHAGAATALGWAENALFDLPSDLPLLIMGGTQDGCIANSASRYGVSSSSATDRVEKTFDIALTRARGDCYLAILEGANHFSMAWPADHSTGRPFIDLPTTQPDEEVRARLSHLICQFSLAVANNNEQARLQLEAAVLNDRPMINRGDRR
ncbi:MAG: pimeloyl-ACP methyl ester carboxylesterase [Halieaceae bacterium]|jgi:pimeloyl-ACP methyl ester carboxylesterase